MASLAAIGIGATANIIGTEATHLIDNVSHYVEEKVHGFIESHTTGKRKRRREDLNSATNDESQHLEDVWRPDYHTNNNHNTPAPVHSDGPNTETGFKHVVEHSYNADELYAASPGKWAVEHLRAKMGADLFQKLVADNMFLTGIAIDWSFLNETNFPITLRMCLVQDMRFDELDKLDTFDSNRNDFFAKAKGKLKYNFDSSGNPVPNCFDNAKKIVMKLNPERYKVIWNKYIALNAAWPGTSIQLGGHKNHGKGRFFIKIPNGVKIKSVHGTDLFTDSHNAPVNKIVPNLKLFFWWEFNNMSIDLMRQQGNENFNKALKGYIHMNTYLKH